MKKKIVDEINVIIMDYMDDDVEQSWTVDPSRGMLLGFKLGDACWALLGSSKVSPMLREALNSIELPDYGHVRRGWGSEPMDPFDYPNPEPIRIEDGLLARVELWVHTVELEA